MIKLLSTLPLNPTVALSGGSDSMAVIAFLQKGHRQFQAAFFDHGTEDCALAKKFVEEYCTARQITLSVGHIEADRPIGKSLEEHWRDERYKYLKQFETVITGHNLDDCLETYIMSSAHGSPKVIPYKRGNVVRPFLLSTKEDMKQFCQTTSTPWFEDRSNASHDHMRNYVRAVLVPGFKVVNPGIYRVIERIVKKRMEQE